MGEIEEIYKHTNLEIESFVHGALCVCHSGMCLMSSCIGGRSGNRGMCAQPCRLPYSMTENSKSNYPLSLKDLCLAGHINEITDLGVTSLKIEGRMKSPEYVYGVTSLYRKLLDEKRNATREEMQYLYDLFSRSGFTDKYFTGEYKKDNQNMYGIRSQSDKERTNALSENLKYDLPKRKISAVCQIESGKTPKLAFTCDEISVVVAGDFLCEEAKNAPVTECDIKNGISKLGNTCFELKEQDIKVTLSENVFLTKSMLNSLRRSATNALEKKLLENNLYPEEHGKFSILSLDNLEQNKGIFDVEYKNGKATVTKRDSGDYDISLTAPAAAKLLLCGEGHTSETAIYIDGVELKTDANSFFKAFPHRPTHYADCIWSH